jgi:hypothetical protein
MMVLKCLLPSPSLVIFPLSFLGDFSPWSHYIPEKQMQSYKEQVPERQGVLLAGGIELGFDHSCRPHLL